MLTLILWAQLGAFLSAPERLLISADDAAFGRAIVRSADQHVAGSVELLPSGAAVPPRVLRLVVHSDGNERVTLVLSRSPKLSVTRVLRIAGSHGLFDRAEVVALVINDMRARLNEQIERANVAALARPPGALAAAASRFAALPLPAPEPRAPVRAFPPEPPASPGPDDPDGPAGPQGLSPTPPESLRALTPVFAAPQLHPIPAPLTFALTQPAIEPSANVGRRWRIGLGVALDVVGLAVGGLGVASLALDGRCVDGGVPCDYRFDGRTAGTVEAVLGGAAVLAGLGLVASLGYERRTLRRLSLLPRSSRTGRTAYVEF